ncbi:MAG TPA: radical SAM protein [Candidatus Wallbacteria bacterium]|mgnify:CR=1 FL=1|nr:radical SAM protein [Candidatus Wallbacteria bacterium]
MRRVICTFPVMKFTDEKPVQIKNSFISRSSSPYNIYLLASIMENNGYEVDIKDWISLNCDVEEAAKELLEYDLVMISCLSWSWPPVIFIIDYLRKKRNDQIIVVGGVQASLFGVQILEEFEVDYAVCGEAERSIIPLIETIEKKGDPRRVPGLVYKENGAIIKNELASLLNPSEIGELPLPLYERLPKDSCNWLSIQSSRGCRNRCIYCSVPYHRSWRPLEPEKFVEKIIEYSPFLKRTLSGKFMIIDDNFTINPERSIAIAKLSKQKGVKFDAIWNAEVPDLYNSELLSKMAPFTDGILVGAESFDAETILKIGKGYKPEDIVAGALNAQKCGISNKLICSFIIGFPWQTKEMIIEEINQIYDLVNLADLNVIINWLTLSPGSRLWAEKFKQPIKLREFSKQFRRMQENINILTNQDIEEIKMYIKLLQSNIENGYYRFQHHPSIFYIV